LQGEEWKRERKEREGEEKRREARRRRKGRNQLPTMFWPGTAHDNWLSAMSATLPLMAASVSL